MKKLLRGYRLCLTIALTAVVVLACENPTASGNDNPTDSPPQFSGSLVYRDHVSSEGIDHLGQIHGVVTAEIDGTPYVFASAYGGDAVTSFQLGADGSLTEIEFIEDDDDLEIGGAGYPAVATVGDAQFLVAPGYIDSGFSVFRMNSDGTLTNTDNVSPTEKPGSQDTYSIRHATKGDNEFLYAIGSNTELGDQDIAVFRLETDGTASCLGSTRTGESNDPPISEVYDTAIIQVQDHSLLVAASYGTNEATVLKIEDDGSLKPLATIDGEAVPFSLI